MIQWILHSYARHYWQSPFLFRNVSDQIDHHLKDQDDHERAERFCIRLSALKSPSHPSEQAFSAKKYFKPSVLCIANNLKILYSRFQMLPNYRYICSLNSYFDWPIRECINKIMKAV